MWVQQVGETLPEVDRGALAEAVTKTEHVLVPSQTPNTADDDDLASDTSRFGVLVSFIEKVKECDRQIIRRLHVDLERVVEFFWGSGIPEGCLELFDVGGERLREVVVKDSSVVNEKIYVSAFRFDA